MVVSNCFVFWTWDDRYNVSSKRLHSDYALVVETRRPQLRVLINDVQTLRQHLQQMPHKPLIQIHLACKTRHELNTCYRYTRPPCSPFLPMRVRTYNSVQSATQTLGQLRWLQATEKHEHHVKNQTRRHLFSNSTIDHRHTDTQIHVNQPTNDKDYAVKYRTQ
jgi:hypothetical protein